MNSIDQSPYSVLFKAKDTKTDQEVFFENPQQAYEWMLTHQNCILKKREIISWSFPLEKTIEQECWIKV